jgi:predicted dienelactone hydrolase
MFMTRLKWGRPLFLLLAVWLSAASRSALAQAGPADSASWRTNLLVFHKRTGQVAPIRSRADWEERRKEILLAMQSVMGPLPGKEKRCALDLRVESETDCGSYSQKLISYASEPGGRVPAYLLIPKETAHSREKFPAILALHPTEMELGHRVVVEPMRKNYRAYGRDLVQRGYVVLAPAYPLMANYQPDLQALGYRSGTMKAIWDNVRGLDLLETLPYVDKKKFGAIGHSLGGHNSIYTAIFEPRLRVVVTSCGFDSYQDYKGGDITGWTSERYMRGLAAYKTRLREVPFDFYEMLAALAPRQVFINAPLRDANFNWQSVDRTVAAASAIYRLEGAPQSLIVEHPDCEHDFPPEIREKAYKLIDEVLR